MVYGRKEIKAVFNEETTPNNKMYINKVYVREYLGLRKGISIQNQECVLSLMISRGEKVWDFCRGCEEEDCRYNLGLEARTEV